MTIKKNGIGFWVFYCLFALIVLALLEFNKNMVIGWVLAAIGSFLFKLEPFQYLLEVVKKFRHE